MNLKGKTMTPNGTLALKVLNLVLPVAGITLMVVYEICAGSCAYLKGSFLGIDLKYVGIIFMGVLLVLGVVTSPERHRFAALSLTFLLSAAVGVEFYLIGFQMYHGTYCPYCLAFSGCVFALFAINQGVMDRRLMVAFVVLGLLGFAVFFEGSITPSYGLLQGLARC